jgi:Putative antitoxin
MTTTNQNNDDIFSKNMFTNNHTIMRRKTITINEDTHRELVKLGIYGESIDDIIKRLIGEHKEKHKK